MESASWRGQSPIGYNTSQMQFSIAVYLDLMTSKSFRAIQLTNCDDEFLAHPIEQILNC